MQNKHATSKVYMQNMHPKYICKIHTCKIYMQICMHNYYCNTHMGINLAHNITNIAHKQAPPKKAKLFSLTQVQ